MFRQLYPEFVAPLVWVDRSGHAEPLPLPPARYLWPRFSPDGTRLAYAAGPPGHAQLGVYDIGLGVPIPLPVAAGASRAPVWDPDGKRLAFTRPPSGGLFSIAADGSEAATQIGDGLATSSWSNDNILAFLHNDDPGEPAGIWTLRMDGASRPEAFVETESAWPAFSPDGNWIAYGSRETGRWEVYVRPFPKGTPVHRISSDGGREPLWSPDGRQLFYVEPAERAFRRVMVLEVAGVQPTFSRGRPRLLFDGSYTGTFPSRSYDISADGQRFVMVGHELEVEPQPVISINIVLSWFDELQERVLSRVERE